MIETLDFKDGAMVAVPLVQQFILMLNLLLVKLFFKSILISTAYLLWKLVIIVFNISFLHSLLDLKAKATKKIFFTFKTSALHINFETDPLSMPI